MPVKSVTHSLFFCVLSISFLHAQEIHYPSTAETREYPENSSDLSCCRFHKREAKKKKKYISASPKKSCHSNKEKDDSGLNCCRFHNGQGKKHKKAHSLITQEQGIQTGGQKNHLPSPKEKVDKKSLSPHALIAEIYANLSGNQITAAESDLIKKKGGNPTYGEIKPESLTKLLQELAITKNDVLYDLGSGTGKVVIQSYLEFPFKKVVGTELSEYRYKQAMDALAQLKKRGLIKKKRTISFIQGDIVETSCTDATVIYMCSTCFSDELMTKLAEKISQLKKGTRVITLKQLPNPKKYKLALMREYRLAMSWSTPEGSPVYVYERTA